MIIDVHLISWVKVEISRNSLQNLMCMVRLSLQLFRVLKKVVLCGWLFNLSLLLSMVWNSQLLWLLQLCDDLQWTVLFHMFILQRFSDFVFLNIDIVFLPLSATVLYSLWFLGFDHIQKGLHHSFIMELSNYWVVTQFNEIFIRKLLEIDNTKQPNNYFKGRSFIYNKSPNGS